MTNYNRRFTKDEFKQELFSHLRDMPPGHLQSPKKIEQNAAMKAEHYARALDALDAAMDKVKKIAATHPDSQAQQEADDAVKDINNAINAYGEASMAGNSDWNKQWNSES